jgi:molecular chaperone DnaK (HSP70)
MAMQRLKEAAEKAKIELSSTTDYRDQSAVYHASEGGVPNTLVKTLTRASLSSWLTI